MGLGRYIKKSVNGTQIYICHVALLAPGRRFQSAVGILCAIKNATKRMTRAEQRQYAVGVEIAFERIFLESVDGIYSSLTAAASNDPAGCSMALMDATEQAAGDPTLTQPRLNKILFTAMAKLAFPGSTHGRISNGNQTKSVKERRFIKLFVAQCFGKKLHKIIDELVTKKKKGRWMPCVPKCTDADRLIVDRVVEIAREGLSGRAYDCRYMAVTSQCKSNPVLLRLTDADTRSYERKVWDAYLHPKTHNEPCVDDNPLDSGEESWTDSDDDGGPDDGGGGDAGGTSGPEPQPLPTYAPVAIATHVPAPLAIEAGAGMFTPEQLLAIKQVLEMGYNGYARSHQYPTDLVQATDSVGPTWWTGNGRPQVNWNAEQPTAVVQDQTSALGDAQSAWTCETVENIEPDANLDQTGASGDAQSARTCETVENTEPDANLHTAPVLRTPSPDADLDRIQEMARTVRQEANMNSEDVLPPADNQPCIDDPPEMTADLLQKIQDIRGSLPVGGTLDEYLLWFLKFTGLLAEAKSYSANIPEHSSRKKALSTLGGGQIEKAVKELQTIVKKYSDICLKLEAFFREKLEYSFVSGPFKQAVNLRLETHFQFDSSVMNAFKHLLCLMESIFQGQSFSPLEPQPVRTMLQSCSEKLTKLEYILNFRYATLCPTAFANQATGSTDENEHEIPNVDLRHFIQFFERDIEMVAAGHLPRSEYIQGEADNADQTPMDSGDQHDETQIEISHVRKDLQLSDISSSSSSSTSEDDDG